MQLSDQGAELIANYEGFVPSAYWDHDHYSIGYGTRARSPNEGPITRAQGLERMRDAINETYGKAVDDLNRKHDLGLNQNQFDALTSFVYNLGPGVIDAGTIVGQALRQKDWERAADAMLPYDKASGVTLAGLTRRRQQERALFLKRPPIRYSDAERRAFERLRNGTRQQQADARAWLGQQATRIMHEARKDGPDGWKIRDRGRRYQGIRRRLRR